MALLARASPDKRFPFLDTRIQEPGRDLFVETAKKS